MEVAADPALHHLLPALNRLREPWISAFFNPTKEQHLSQLDHALKNQTLTGTAYLSSTTSIPSERIAPDITFVFAPSFSTGSTTVGFDLSHGNSLWNPMGPISSPRSVSRALRDDATGMLISITPLSTDTEIALSRLTPSGRTISLIRLTNAAFQGLLSNLNSGSTLYAFQAIHSGPVSTLHAEDNLCPSLWTKFHPMDFAAERRNISCFIGGFESVAQLRAYNCGRLIASDKSFARLGMDVTHDGAVVRDMGDWAIQQAVMGCCIRVPGLCVPSLEMISDEDMEELDMGKSDRRGNVGEFGANDVFKLLAGLGDHFDDTHLDGSTLTLMNGDGDNEQEVPLLKNSLEDFDVGEDGTFSKSIITNVMTETAPQITLLQDDVNKASREKHFAFPQPGNNPAIDHCTPEHYNQPSSSAEKVHVIEHIAPRRAVPIAPAEANLAGRTFISESQRKEERRKARNRASALRSNEKKRLYLKKLKEDIAAAAKREEVLRKRERLLRLENRELRVALKH